ncbi:MAG: AAA family ATPase [Bacteroidetes bacterium]|nr:AAA family ATPase [Bacteroidota bacterium]
MSNQALTIPKPAGNIIEQKDIKRTISLLLKNWYWFVILIAISSGLAILFLYKATKFYGATTTILLKKKENAIESAFKGNMRGEGEQLDITNEMLILSSRRLINETIEKLDLDVSYLIEGRIKTGEVYKGTPFYIEGKLLDPALFNCPFNVQILSTTSYRISLDESYGAFEKVEKFGNAINDRRFSITLYGQDDILKNNTSIKDVKYKFIFNKREELISKFQKSLKLSQEKDASAIVAEMEDVVQDRAVDFLRTLTNIYIENSIAVNKEVNDATLTYLDAEIKAVSSALGSSQNIEVSYKSGEQLPDIGAQTTVAISQKASLEEKRNELIVKLEYINRLDELLKTDEEDVSAYSAVLGSQNDPALSMSLSELLQLKQRKIDLGFTYQPNSPQIKEVDQKVAGLKSTIIGSVRTIRRTYSDQINSIGNQLGSISGKLFSIPKQQTTLTNLTRNVELNNKMYLFLMETRAQTMMAKAAIVADKSILEPAIAQGLIKPIPAKVLITGFGAGLALALLTIFFRSIYYNYITSKDDLSEITHLPILGVIAKTKEAEKEYMIVDKFPQSIASEAFRVIRSNLAYYGPKDGCKVSLFTSSVASEGKTFCAVNTGIILAKSKKKVILIDLDLHKPKQANAFNLQNDIGVTSYMVGKANLKVSLKKHRFQIYMLYFRGHASLMLRNFCSMLLLEEMINQLKKDYDYIIMDTAPVGLISDALELMKFADLTLYVLKANYSKKDFVDVVHHIAEKKDVKGIGLVLNAVSQKNITAGYGGGYYK